jgi:UDP-N-acetylglucosamine/UDP-N-acetylgalactosamine diphosphorylase
MGLEARYEQFRNRLEALGQGHVLTFWPQLGDQQRGQLLADLDLCDLEAVSALVRDHLDSPSQAASYADLEPVAPLPCRPDLDQVGGYADAVRLGREWIAAGKVAALTVAGGQGTRLGFDGPKGMFPISPVRHKTLFQLFAESLQAVARRYGRTVPWYIMTSRDNDDPTRAFFAEQRYFGLSPEDVCFFQQGVMPAFDGRGRFLLAEPHRLSLSPDGHGGTLLALRRSGALEDMGKRGVEYISYFQVDNPLVSVLDPLFIGLHASTGSEMSSRSLPKADDFEKVGNFAWSSGRLFVVEYSDLPDALATARNADGSRNFNAGSPAIHVLTRSFVERLTADEGRFGLPWHRAEKKVPYVDASGQRVEPTEPNGIKLETFIFDALPLAENPLVLEASRAEQFSPVKNATGQDSADTARRDLIRRAAAWLEAAGCDVPQRSDGEPDAVIEISPFLALDRDELCEKVSEPPVIQPGQQLYLE